MNNQWHTYQTLEQIPTSISAPQIEKTTLQSWLDGGWQSFLGSLIGKFGYEKQMDHLEHCFSLGCSQSTVNATFWQRLWDVLNQPLGSGRSPFPNTEPQIQQVSDRDGHTWWQAYDPLTRQTIFLESEQDVMIWLEERLYL